MHIILWYSRYLEEFLKESTTIEGSQLRQYMHSIRTEFSKKDGETLLSWWDRSPFHDVKQMSFNILSIPATSAEMERVFSMARRMITDDHHRMTDDHGGHNDAGILVEEGIDHARPVDR